MKITRISKKLYTALHIFIICSASVIQNSSACGIIMPLACILRSSAVGGSQVNHFYTALAVHGVLWLACAGIPSVAATERKRRPNAHNRGESLHSLYIDFGSSSKTAANSQVVSKESSESEKSHSLEESLIKLAETIDVQVYDDRSSEHTFSVEQTDESSTEEADESNSVHRYSTTEGWDINGLDNVIKIEKNAFIIVNETMTISDEIIESIALQLKATPEPLGPISTEDSVNSINERIELGTDSNIRNIISVKAIKGDIVSVFAGTAHFKSEWTHEFKMRHIKQFWSNESGTFDADVVYFENMQKVKYGHILEVDATAVELPYRALSVSMIIVLPNKLEGLVELRHKMTAFDFQRIATRLKESYAFVTLPKFKVDFDIDWRKSVVDKLRMSRMIERNCSAIDTTPETHITQQLLEVVTAAHRFFLQLDEHGAEASEATVAINSTQVDLIPEPNTIDVPEFVANRSFIFAIRDEDEVYFSGEVVKLSS